MSSADTANQRSNRRLKTLLPGVVTTLDGRSAFDCVIKDLSGTGAKLTIPKSAKIEPPFLVINVRDRLAHRASIVWYAQNTIGVRYHETFPINSSLDPSLQFLTRLWLQRATA